MRRRMVLATVPSFLAGCIGANNNSRHNTTTTHTTRSTTETATTPATTETTAETTTKQPYDLVPVDPESMTESEVRQRLADRSCTEFTDHSSTCPNDDDRLGVTVSPNVVGLSDATVEFTVENSTDEHFKTNHYNWVLRKWDGNRWRRIAPLAIPAPLHRISAGESYTHRITPVESKVVRSQHAYVAESEITLGGLGPGVYGFSTSGYFESTPDEELTTGAVFGLAGEAPPVRPTDDVARVERNESTLVVHADAPSGKQGELVVSLVDDEADAQLLAEHVHQLGALLNTLPYAATDAVETIRYEGRADDVDMVSSYLPAVTPDDVTHYRFHDYVFELSVEDG